MKNITVSVPEAIYRQARIRAAERDRSVSALVREFLASLGDEESERDRRKRLQREVLGTIRRFRGADRVGREAVHRRRAAR